MESTGVYWKPVWHALCQDFELILANPAHMKAIPGQKTDKKDAFWIAKSALDSKTEEVKAVQGQP